MGLARRVLARRGKFWPLLPDVARVYTGGNSHSTATRRHGQSLSNTPKRKKLFWRLFFFSSLARLCLPNAFLNEPTLWPTPPRKRSFAAPVFCGMQNKKTKVPPMRRQPKQMALGQLQGREWIDLQTLISSPPRRAHFRWWCMVRWRQYRVSHRIL